MMRLAMDSAGGWILKGKDDKTIYAARGRGGQHVIVMPEKNIIVVILQEWTLPKKDRTLENKLLGELLEIL